MISAVLKIQQDNVERYRKAVLGRRVCQREDLGEVVSRLSKKLE